VPEAIPGKPASGTTEADLDRAMDRYAQGDDAAFSVVYPGLYPRLRLFLLRLCRTQALADDLLQEAFLRIHRARGSFSAGCAVVPWAYAIARNVHTDHARSAHVRRTTSIERPDDEGAGETDVPAGPAANAEEVSIARQTANAVEVALASLPPAQREAFVLLRYEGMSVADAARILGATENAVKLRAFHAYEALRAALGIAKKGEATKHQADRSGYDART
jgi:RNA polymerase sigma-70 factor (ECF subfamily)